MTDDEYTITPALVLDPGETRTYDVDFFDKCAAKWVANEDYSAAEYVRPTGPKGFAYQSGGGTSGGKEPRWPTVLAQTVVDGSVTWTCSAAGANGLNAITSPSAVSDPTGLTVTSVSVVETRKIRLTVAGGVAGQDFDLVFTFTLSGVTRVARQKVQVRKR